MVVIPREICRDSDKALSHEWIVTNNRDSYAAASILGALTRPEHGLLVARIPDSAQPFVTLAKVDEEVEVGDQVYKLGTNDYKGDVIDPDGFLYLYQVEYDGHSVRFTYEGGRFQLHKRIWMEPDARTTFIRYTLAEHSAPVVLTLLPLCDYRSNQTLTTGSEEWRFRVEPLPGGFAVCANGTAVPYRIFVEHAEFTPLELWYWRFELRAAAKSFTDLFVPGLYRIDLKPGKSCTMIATLDRNSATEDDASRSFAALQSRAAMPPRVLPDQFNSESFRMGPPDAPSAA